MATYSLNPIPHLLNPIPHLNPHPLLQSAAPHRANRTSGNQPWRGRWPQA